MESFRRALVKTHTVSAAIVAMIFLAGSAFADDYGWSGSSSRSHVGSGYGRSSGHYDNYSNGYGSSANSHYDGYGPNYGRPRSGYGYSNSGYRNVPTRIGLAPVSSRYSNYPAYGTGYGSDYGSGYSGNTGYCPYDRIGYGSGYYGR